MTSEVKYFQDYFPIKDECVDGRDLDTVAGEAFFELANSKEVGFRINEDKEIRVIQDNNCQTHTGGIVWETAYLLACFLMHQAKQTDKKKPLGKVLEIGSGCGMLGMILCASKLAKKVVMTETTEVMENLSKNLLANIKTKGKENRKSYGACPNDRISTYRLDWTQYKKDVEACQKKKSDDLNPHSFDTIIGTDVIFTQSLVKPLLKTLQHMSHDKTEIFLCVQIRCQDSYDLLFKKASKYDFILQDKTQKFADIKELEWGLAMDCKLLHFTVNKTSNKRSRKTEKEEDPKRMKRNRKRKGSIN